VKRLPGARVKRLLAGLMAAALLALPPLLSLPALAVQRAAPIRVVYPAPVANEIITPVWLDGVRYVSTNDLARVFRATKYWRPELRKLSLRLGDHTVRFTVDAPVVLVDEDAKNLVLSPRLLQGEVYVPETVLAQFLEWGLITNATWDEPIRTIRFRAPVHTVRQAQLWVRGHVTEISATLLRSLPPRVLYATPTEVRLLFEGGTIDTARVFAGGVVQLGTIRETQDGVETRLLLTPDAKGYSVTVAANRLKVAVTDDKDLVSAGIFSPLEPISLAGADGKFGTVVLDPGHGGGDSGATLPGGQLEKDATLDFARQIRAELTDKLGVRVVLTREADIDVPLSRRAEIANETRGDLFISVHLDAEGALRQGGFRVYALSPSLPASTGADRIPLGMNGDFGGAELRPWDSAQASVAGNSMALAQAIADGLSRGFPQTPVTFHTGRISVLEPVAYPAILIEVAPPPRGAPEAMSLRGYSLRDVAKSMAQTIQEFLKGGGA